MTTFPRIQAIIVIRWTEDTTWTKDGYWVRLNPFYNFTGPHPLTGK